MTEVEVTQLKKLIVAAAANYRLSLAPEVIQMRAAALKDLDFNMVSKAYSDWLKSSAAFDPLPGQIRAKINPQVSERDLARDAAARIIGAVSRFGWPNGEEARAYIGEVGWRVIQTMGGWNHTCEVLGTGISEGQAMAQWRDHAESLLMKEKAGVLNTPPSFPVRGDQKQIGSFGAILQKSLEGKNMNDQNEKQRGET